MTFDLISFAIGVLAGFLFGLAITSWIVSGENKAYKDAWGMKE